jgi:hypothetical protein
VCLFRFCFCRSLFQAALKGMVVFVKVRLRDVVTVADKRRFWWPLVV